MDKLIPLFLTLYYVVGLTVGFNIRCGRSGFWEKVFFRLILAPLLWSAVAYFDGKTRERFLAI